MKVPPPDGPSLPAAELTVITMRAVPEELATLVSGKTSESVLFSYLAVIPVPLFISQFKYNISLCERGSVHSIWMTSFYQTHSGAVQGQTFPTPADKRHTLLKLHFLCVFSKLVV